MTDRFTKLAKSHDRAIISEIYDIDARYWPTDSEVIIGQNAIVNFWSSQIDFFTDLKLQTTHLTGTEEFINESGEGYASYYTNDSEIDTLKFYYINLWKRQGNGSYKLYYDMYKKRK